jgi:hypothetical protein
MLQGYSAVAEAMEENRVPTAGGPERQDEVHSAPAPDRPLDIDLDTVAATGKASEALEWVERARGHLYTFHQMIGHADFLFGDAVDMLRAAGHDDAAAHLADDIVGRNVLDGRWTFQIVDEFDDLYYRAVAEAVRRLERELTHGHRHLYESWLKEQRRTRGHSGHECRPPSAHWPNVVTEHGPS